VRLGDEQLGERAAPDGTAQEVAGGGIHVERPGGGELLLQLPQREQREPALGRLRRARLGRRDDRRGGGEQLEFRPALAQVQRRERRRALRRVGDPAIGVPLEIAARPRYRR
jgi:hypothetical protein